MIVWRGFLVMFGGFYEAMRDLKWFNDLFIFSFQGNFYHSIEFIYSSNHLFIHLFIDQRWTQIKYKPNSQVVFSSLSIRK